MRFIPAFLVMVILVPFSVMAAGLILLDFLARGEKGELGKNLQDSFESIKLAWVDMLKICVDCLKLKK